MSEWVTLLNERELDLCLRVLVTLIVRWLSEIMGTLWTKAFSRHL